MPQNIQNLFTTSEAKDLERYFSTHFNTPNQYLNVFIHLDSSYKLVTFSQKSIEGILIEFGGLAFSLVLLAKWFSKSGASNAFDKALIKRSYQV